MWCIPWLMAAVSFVVIWILLDIVQRKHAIIHNFPIIGHFRYWLESIGPELRQYIVTGNNEERPFSRDQRSWVYASSKHENNYFGFGTDNDLELSPNHLIVHHAAFPVSGPMPGDANYNPRYLIPCAKVLGRHRGRAKAFRPESIVNISGMSYGALSSRAVGCDMVNVAREAMLSVGCIQALRCHTGYCPTGVTAQNKWLMSGLDPTLKAARLANYIATLRKELLQLSHACGKEHPALVTTEHISILDDHFGATSALDCFRCRPGWGVPSAADRDEIVRLMSAPRR